MNFRITKTSYLQFLKCPAEFWLDFHEPLFAAAPITLEREHLRQQGYAVEQLVRDMARFQSDGTALIEFQRTFQTAELAARSDIVVTDKATGDIDIYEIKAAGNLKEEHYDDVAFQMLVAERVGFRIRRAHLVTMNSEYVREGDLDVEQLFTVTDVTETVRPKLPVTEERIGKAFEYLASVPVPSLAEYCIDNKLDCRFIKRHFSDLPEYTVFDISYLQHDPRRQLLRQGIISILDVPDNFPLGPKQRQQVDIAKSREIIINTDEIARRIGEWEYPLHFLDYETLCYAIPLWDGVKPFQQMCFQYSLDTIARPGAELTHSEFLSHGDDWPPRALAEHLRDAFAGGIGTVFVWYEAFEKGRNEEMAAMFPDLADFFIDVNARTYDLMKIFSENLYVHPEFKGRTSIKKVLPVLVPELSYKELGIGDGMTATISWFRAVKWETLSIEERERAFCDLEKYCELDTVAMVEIFRHLVSLAPSRSAVVTN